MEETTSVKETSITDENSSVQKARSPKKSLGISGARHIVQIAVFLLFALPLVVSGWALLGLTASDSAQLATPASLPFYGTLSSSSIGGVAIVDFFAGLQVMLAAKTIIPAMIPGMLIVLVVYGLIRGRAFCGWICPVNMLMEFVDWLRRKTHIQPMERALPRHTKIWVAVAILVLSLVFSVPVYEIFNPISALNKLLVLGSWTGILTLVAIIIVELFWGHRVWCRSICPLGGFYEVIGKVGLVNVKLNRNACIHCNKCKAVCLCDSEILDPTIDGSHAFVKAGDCMLCGKCVDACPTKALSIGVGRPSK